MTNRTKLTPFVKKKVVEYIEMGMPIGKAANAVGVAHQTFDRWVRRGESPVDGNGDSIFVQLVQDLATAEANFIKRNVARVDKGADRNTEDAKWLLERRDPGEFGKRVELDIGPSKVLIALQEKARALRDAEYIGTTEAKALPPGDSVAYISYDKDKV